jgi:hypothetical protein
MKEKKSANLKKIAKKSKTNVKKKKCGKKDI